MIGLARMTPMPTGEVDSPVGPVRYWLEVK